MGKKKKTLEELFNSGELKKGQWYFKAYYRYVRILGLKIRKRKCGYDIYRFVGKDVDGYFVFELRYEFQKCFANILPCSGASYCGGQTELMFKPIREIRIM